MYWLGHASFLLESPAGVRLVTDPFGPEVLPVPDVSADIVTVSHEHFDHNHLKTVKGDPQVWRGLTADGKDWEKLDKTYKDIRAYTVATYHDEAMGAKRGKNAVFVFEIGKLRLAHLGDLGHVLNEEQVKEIGSIDVLMLPVGGTFTIDADQAWQVVEALKPRVVVPMHYLLDGMKDFPIAPVSNFTGGHANVRQLGAVKIDRTAEALPSSTEIWVLDPIR
ncbi:MAG: MBL fold metallo-hydrolase [Clostridia bacterium]|nr:MBL fold metallo-hydrolase [Clostridia bacterium]